MTIAQIKEAGKLINKRADIQATIDSLSETYEIDFCTSKGNLHYAPRNVSGELKVLHQEIIQAAQEVAISVLTKKRNEITAELRALGVEE